MRVAELVMAVVLALLSVYLMWKATELPIGWIENEGPGGGAVPFWLGAGMLLCTLWIIVRSMMRTSPLSQSAETYLDARAKRLFFIIGGSLTIAIGLTHVIGMYFALPLFLAFYMRFLGGHRWRQVAMLAIALPIFIFFFFV